MGRRQKAVNIAVWHIARHAAGHDRIKDDFMFVLHTLILRFGFSDL
jgi:hypothetical protein